MGLNKVFGIVSYFPDEDTDINQEICRTRIPRLYSLISTLGKLWPNIDIMIIAQNWGDRIHLPDVPNKVIIYSYPKLGVRGAKVARRERFLESDYDYLIMLDDDGIISTDNPDLYMQEIDKHPNGVGVIRHKRCPLMLMAISKYIFSLVDIPEVDPEYHGGWDDDIFVVTCFYKFPDKAFDFTKGIIEESSFKYRGEDACLSSWYYEISNNDRKLMDSNTARIISEITNGEVDWWTL